jgi:hypothetical protein
MSLLLIAMFKNEAMIMEEWIEHYINEGVDCFLLIDNGSTDNYEQILQKYIDAGYVILNKNPKRHAQVEIYNGCLGCARKFDWTMIVDLDEFVYARNGFDTIRDYLGSLDSDISQIHIPWKMFGSSGLIEQPKSVINGFIWRESYENPKKIECKSIFRGNLIEKIDIHTSFLKKNSNKEIFADNSISDKNVLFLNHLSEEFLSNSFLHLNHYAIQSWEFFEKIKMTRGAADTILSNNVRNKQYFESYDHKDREDDELKNKQYKTTFSLTDQFIPKENLLIKDIEIVVSRYNESLDWINRYPFNQFQYTIYNKGINDHFNQKNVKKIIPLKNVGTCDHTYLYHIVSHYNHNSLKPITIFLPGSIDVSHKINKSVDLLIKVLLTQQAFFMGEHTINLFHTFKDFTIDHHVFSSKENLEINNRRELIKSHLRPYGRWFLYNFGKINVSYYTYQGIFSVNKKDVMKHRKIRYEKLLNQLSIGSNLEVAHYMERSWGALFYPMLHTKIFLTYKIPEPMIENKNINSTTSNMRGILPMMRMGIRARRNNVFNRPLRNRRLQNYRRGLLARRRNINRNRNRNVFRKRNQMYYRFF